MSEIDTGLTAEELEEIAAYTVHKINCYPKEYGKTVENYFDLLYPDEVKDYILRREINRQGRINYERRMADAQRDAEVRGAPV